MDGTGSEVLGFVLRDPEALAADERIDYLVELQKLESFIAAQRQKTLAAIADESDPLGGSGKQWCREDVACALRYSYGTAGQRLALAQQLVRQFPDTLDALEAGQITELHCRILLDAVHPLDQSHAGAVEARVLARAGEQTAAEFRRSVTRAVLAADPASAEQRHERAYADRTVASFAGEDGMATCWSLLAADDAATLMAALTHLATTDVPESDDRTVDQRRADALVDLAAHALYGPRTPGGMDSSPADGAGPARRAGKRPAIQVTVALSTLLGLDDQPGDLDGHGPVPAALARALAADPTGTWRRLVTDDHGRLLDFGRTTYRPPAALADFVVARDATCRMPGCSRPARRCQLDHITDFARGGTTSPDCLHALCCRHHHGKHDRGWRPRRRTDGTTQWTSPTGHRYQKPPPELPIDCTVPPLGDPPPTEPPAVPVSRRVVRPRVRRCLPAARG